jgi:hypothetical protein
MTWRKYAAGAGAIAGLLASTAAFAADATRSGGALPAVSAQKAMAAPTNGLRTSSKLKKKSHALGGPGAIVGGVLATAIVVGGVIIATDDDDEPDSAG